MRNILENIPPEEVNVEFFEKKVIFYALKPFHLSLSMCVCVCFNIKWHMIFS